MGGGDNSEMDFRNKEENNMITLTSLSECGTNLL